MLAIHNNSSRDQPRLAFAIGDVVVFRKKVGEPTAGLDPVNAHNVKTIIKSLRDERKTIVLATHNMNDVDELCDRVTFMVEGRFAVIDTPEALKAKFGRRVVTVDYGIGDDSRSEEFDLDGLGADAHFLDVIRTREIRKIHSQEAHSTRSSATSPA